MARKCALHGVNSDHVLHMPMTGLPSKRWLGNPWFFIQLRWMKPPLSARPNHSELRSSRFDDIKILRSLRTDGRIEGVTKQCWAESVPRAVASVTPGDDYLREPRSLPL